MKFFLIFLINLIILIHFVPSVLADTPPVYTPSGSLYYYHQDNLGSNSVMTDDQGNIVSIAKYQAYGDERSRTGSKIGERTYTDQIKDDTSNLMYYNARYYNPKLGIFTQPDQIGGIAKYAYASGNPINNSDPTGNMASDEGGGGGGTDCSNGNASGDTSCQGPPQPPPPPPVEKYDPGEGRYSYNRRKSQQYDAPAFNIPQGYYDSVNNRWIGIKTVEDKIDAMSHYANKLMPYSTEEYNIEENLSADNNALNHLSPTNDLYEEIQRQRDKWNQRLIQFAQKQSAASPLDRLNQDLITCYDYPNLVSTWIRDSFPTVDVWATGNIGHGFLAISIPDSTGGGDNFYILDSAWNYSLEPASSYIKRYPWPAAWADYHYGFNPDFSNGSQSKFVYYMSQALQDAGINKPSSQNYNGPQ